MEGEQPPAAAAPAPEKVETKEVSKLLLSDLQKMLDVAVSRGTFRPAELTPVGRVYDALTEVLRD